MIQVQAGGLAQSVLEHLDLLDNRHMLVHFVRERLDQQGLYLYQYGAGVPVLFDERVQGVTILQPLDEAGVGCEGNHGVAMNREVLLGGLIVGRKQGIDEPKELHHPLVLSEVFAPLQQKGVLHAIRPNDGETPWTLFRFYHFEPGLEPSNTDDSLVIVGRVETIHARRVVEVASPPDSAVSLRQGTVQAAEAVPILLIDLG
mmetsp:Transcript_15420/g.37920  ORF Transcript_15420/g.37920 Transcript_15420/m.37920 type:complete len:202 (+) Transcript_15420:1290-1895(+)